LWQAVLNTPQRLTIGRLRQSGWPSAIALAVLVYVLPVMDRRKWVWWAYVVCTLGVIAIVDLARHSVLLDTDRYIFAASPGAYAMLAGAAPTRIGKWVPPLACAAVAIFGIARLQQGADYTVESLYQIEDHRMSAGFLQANARPGDLVIFTGHGPEPAFRYFVACHYDGQWKTAIMLVSDPVSDEVRGEMGKYNRVWVSGRYAVADVARVLPGCPVVNVRSTLFDQVGRLAVGNQAAK
jgi:hypothetical protein